MAFGVEMNLPFDVNAIPKEKTLKNKAKYQMQEIVENIQVAKEVATENIRKSQEKSKER